MRRLLLSLVIALLPVTLPRAAGDETQDAADQVRSILSNRCFACHGPDDDERQGGFRLDERDSFIAAADSGIPPVAPGDPDASELLRRLTTDDDAERMPPEDFGDRLSVAEIELIREWIDDGAELPKHWAFLSVTRPALPEVALPAELELEAGWSQHAVDRFVLAEQLARRLHPSPPATRAELLRRLSLDITGLPPTIEEVREFENDTRLEAYERQVDRLLASPAYGEHWARKWLDMARYADSAGYADDPSRTIWAYRDWVVESLNANMPFDQFTVDQIAGDLLPNPTQQQLVATAFHRNTLTNNEGGTNDEEFRNVAVVDRVNTTMEVWMGVTMACAQCHTHKYDPFTQEEYFKLFAIFNQSQDADVRDESPVISLFTAEQLSDRQQWQRRVEQLELKLSEPGPAALEELVEWEKTLAEPSWQPLTPLRFSALSQSDGRFDSEHSIRVQPVGNNIVTDTYTVDLELPAETAEESRAITAIGLRTLPTADLPGGGAGLGNGNFVITEITGTFTPSGKSVGPAKFVRITLPGESKILSLAEVQVFSGDQNLAVGGAATQSSTDFAGAAQLAIDGNTSGDYAKDQSTTHTAASSAPWWELDLQEPHEVERIVIWNRTDNNLYTRLQGAQVMLLDAARETLFTATLTPAPTVNLELAVVPRTPIRFTAAFSDFAQDGFPASAVADSDATSGWAVGGLVDRSHLLTLIPEQPIEVVGPAKLSLEIKHDSSHRHHLLGSFRVEASRQPNAGDWAQLSPALRDIHDKPVAHRSPEEQLQLATFFNRHLADATAAERREIGGLKQQLEAQAPATSVPVMREVPTEQRRQTFVQLRGNYKSLGVQVEAGMPAIFHPVASPSAAEQARLNRLDLARWLIDERNPLTARVWVNRLWESLTGLGIVRSSEDFGSQGDRPTHPELLDWLAAEFMRSGWDRKQMLRLIVTSQTYRQTSRVSQQSLELDAENVWLSRGPRVRLSAEMIRDQSLSIAGVLSRKMYGPPVRPPQPNLGLSAAFGSGTDWTTSEGEDRFRRGLYTTWRRSNPYPSMATFDAPSREVCTLRRDSTNTPLQALVTLNDPAFVEAAQALARRVVLRSAQECGTDDKARLEYAFQLCTARQPLTDESAALIDLLNGARAQLQGNPSAALQLATDPHGPLPSDASPIELAAWTSVCNVLLNLDEVLMKR